MAEMALCMTALFYFDCLGHRELRNIAHNGLWELYAVTVGWMGGCDGTDGSYPVIDFYDI